MVGLAGFVKRVKAFVWDQSESPQCAIYLDPERPLVKKITNSLAWLFGAD